MPFGHPLKLLAETHRPKSVTLKVVNKFDMRLVGIGDHLDNWLQWPYAEISLVARSRSSLTTRTTLYSETVLEVVLQVSLVVRLASLSS